MCMGRACMSLGIIMARMSKTHRRLPHRPCASRQLLGQRVDQPHRNRWHDQQHDQPAAAVPGA